jgi:hypothetical protein
MTIVAALIKHSEVIDTYTFEMPTVDDLAKAAEAAFAYFRDRHPYMTVRRSEVVIAFRREMLAPAA